MKIVESIKNLSVNKAKIVIAFSTAIFASLFTCLIFFDIWIKVMLYICSGIAFTVAICYFLLFLLMRRESNIFSQKKPWYSEIELQKSFVILAVSGSLFVQGSTTFDNWKILFEWIDTTMENFFLLLAVFFTCLAIFCVNLWFLVDVIFKLNKKS